MNHPSSPIHPFGGENMVRIMHVPASILQAAMLRKTIEIRENGHDCEMLECVRKIIEDASEDDHLACGTWLSANEKLEKGVAIIKSCTPNALGELT
ncbi:hypothetical protein Tco_1334288, partial [Tanacetum coccineum]